MHDNERIRQLLAWTQFLIKEWMRMELLENPYPNYGLISKELVLVWAHDRTNLLVFLLA